MNPDSSCSVEAKLICKAASESSVTLSFLMHRHIFMICMMEMTCCNFKTILEVPFLGVFWALYLFSSVLV